jgi:hypothetical protein
VWSTTRNPYKQAPPPRRLEAWTGMPARRPPTARERVMRVVEGGRLYVVFRDGQAEVRIPAEKAVMEREDDDMVVIRTAAGWRIVATRYGVRLLPPSARLVLARS